MAKPQPCSSRGRRAERSGLRDGYRSHRGERLRKRGRGARSKRDGVERRRCAACRSACGQGDAGQSWPGWRHTLPTQMPAALAWLRRVFAAMLAEQLMGVSHDHACCGRRGPSRGVLRRGDVGIHPGDQRVARATPSVCMARGSASAKTPTRSSDHLPTGTAALAERYTCFDVLRALVSLSAVAA